MPKKTESTGTGLDPYIEKLVEQGSRTGTVTEDDIQVALKDVDVSDAQLNSVYRGLLAKDLHQVGDLQGCATPAGFCHFSFYRG